MQGLRNSTPSHAARRKSVAFLPIPYYVYDETSDSSQLLSVPPLEYWLSFLAGVFGSMHCVGMCGVIVLGYSTQGIEANPSFSTMLSSHLTYNTGRVLGYTLVGGVLGLVGGSLSNLQTIGTWFSLGMGVLLVLFGVFALRIFPALSFAAELSFGRGTRNLLFKLYQSTFGRLIALQGLESKFYIGLMTPLLPCGLLYSMFVQAAGSGSLVSGGLTMMLFGLGIVPALVVTGFASSYFGYGLRRWGDKLAAVTIILMGLGMVWRAWNAGAMMGHQMH
jgi:sulfite exporter TauE/SafE